MQAITSYCLTEPESDSDALHAKAGYRPNGNKAFIPSGGYSDLYLVMFRTGEAGSQGISTISVPDDTPDLSFGVPEHKMSWKAQPTAQVQMDDCTVPTNHLLSSKGYGFHYAMTGLDRGRLNIAAACSLETEAQALHNALDYSGHRKTLGKR